MAGILAVIILVLATFVFCDIQISVMPPYAKSKENVSLVIRCTVDSQRLKLDELYSIMIKKDGQTVVVVSSDEYYSMPQKDSNTARFFVAKNLSANTAYLEVTYHEVTCFDRGDYTCKAAARRAYDNVKLQSVSTRLDVIGDDCKVDHIIVPHKPLYTIGDNITIMCYTFSRSTTFDWHWSNNSKTQNYMSMIKKSCTEKNRNSLFNCSVTFTHHVIEADRHQPLTCGIGKDSITIKLKVANKVDYWIDDEEDKPRTLHTMFSASVTQSSSTSFLVVIVIVILIIVAVIFITVGVIVFRLKGRRNESAKKKNLPENSNSKTSLKLLSEEMDASSSLLSV